MTDFQIKATDNNTKIDLEIGQTFTANIQAHNTDNEAHTNILDNLGALNTQILTKADEDSLPTKVSQLQNDSNFATVSQIPVVPTKLSEFTNDAGYATTVQVNTKANNTLDNISVSSALANLGFMGQSLTTDGYYKFPGGLIIQWGAVSAAANSNTIVTLPIPFPNACLCSYACSGYQLTSGGDWAFIQGSHKISKSQIGVSSTYDWPVNANWFAIGY